MPVGRVDERGRMMKCDYCGCKFVETWRGSCSSCGAPAPQQRPCEKKNTVVESGVMEMMYADTGIGAPGDGFVYYGSTCDVYR